MDSDIRHDVGSVIYVLQACRNDDAADLIAVGTEHSVEVLRVVPLPVSHLSLDLMFKDRNRL